MPPNQEDLLRDIKPIPYFALELGILEWSVFAICACLVIFALYRLNRREPPEKIALFALVLEELARARALAARSPSLAELKDSSFRVSLLVRRYLSAFYGEELVTSSGQELSHMQPQFPQPLAAVSGTILSLEEYKYSPTPAFARFGELIGKIEEALRAHAATQEAQPR